MTGNVLSRMFGLSSYRDKTTALVLTAQESIYKVILVLLTFTAILWMSIFLYATFYYTYMPAISHIRPVHLQFRSCGKERGLCTFPTANVTLTQRQQLLMVGQPYKVVVELEMPESSTNQELGMFMICADLKDAEHNIVDKSCRSAILHYKSFFHHAITTLIYAPFLLSGSAEEKQLVSVELFSGFQEHPGHPATQAYIEVQSQHIQIYQMYLKIHAHFTGLRYFMFHWPILAAALGISTNFFFLAVIGFLSWYKFYHAKQLVLHVGYDANVARSLEEQRRSKAKEKLMKEREQLIQQQKVDEDTADSLIIDSVKSKNKSSNSDEKSKLEEPLKDDNGSTRSSKSQKCDTKHTINTIPEVSTSVTDNRRSSDDFEIIAEKNSVEVEKKTESNSEDNEYDEKNSNPTSEEETFPETDDKENRPLNDDSSGSTSNSQLRKRKTST